MLVTSGFIISISRNGGMADTVDLKSTTLIGVQVQVLFAALGFRYIV